MTYHAARRTAQALRTRARTLAGRLLLASLALPSAAAMTTTVGAQTAHVGICHATGQGTFIFIAPSGASADGHGHAKHADDLIGVASAADCPAPVAPVAPVPPVASPVPVLDTTPPVIGEPIVTGLAGDLGWFRGPVSVIWSVTDAESPVVSTGCGPATVGIDTTGAVLTCTATSAGGSASRSVTVRVDGTAPSLTGAGPESPSGWHRTDVTVRWTAADVTSGIDPAALPAESVVRGEGRGLTTGAVSVRDRAGNATAAAVGGIDIDRTVPVVAYAGNAGTYTVDQDVAIACAASDALSGVASDTCQSGTSAIAGPAYAFALGTNRFSATGTDVAGNTGSGATEFAVRVTGDSLCALTRRFVGQAGLATSLCAKLSAAGAAGLRGNAAAKANALGAYANEVTAQTNKAIAAPHAAVLLRLVSALGTL